MSDEAAKKIRPLKVCTRRFGWVILAGGLLGLQDYSINLQGMRHRKAAFNDDFMEQKFGNF